MEPIITISVSDVLWLAAAIVTLNGAFMALINWVARFKAPNKVQNERIEQLEKEVKDLKDKYNQEHEVNRQSLKVLSALLDHAIDGNNIEQMKEVKRELEYFVIDKLGGQNERIHH